MRIFGLDVRRSAPPQPVGELARIFDLLGIDQVIDIGANFGQYGQLIRSAGFIGRIDSVEPIPACAERLRQVADPAWLVHEQALGASAGGATLRVYRDSSLSSMHELNDLGRSIWDDPSTADELERIEVDVTTLDALLDVVARGQRLWVKCDTQGHDLEVLAGLMRWRSIVVGIQTEVAFTSLYEGAPTADAHFRCLANMGFTLAGLFPIGRVDGVAITEADCLFVRANEPRT